MPATPEGCCASVDRPPSAASSSVRRSATATSPASAAGSSTSTRPTCWPTSSTSWAPSQGICAAVGATVRYVKPHGALYNAVVHHEAQAAAVVEAVRRVDPSLPVLGLPGSVLLAVAQAAGLPTVPEAFADRAYTPTGRLVPRSEEGAVLHDPDSVAARAVRMVLTGRVDASDGSAVPVAARSLCVHGDSPGAVSMATAVRTGLEAAGVTIRPFVAADPRPS